MSQLLRINIHLKQSFPFPTKDLTMEYPSSFTELFSSYWWWDWFSAPDGNDKDYDACMSRQNTKRTSDRRPYS
jgi:hypothetical protein